MSPADAPAPSRSPWFWAGIALALAPVEVLVWLLAVSARRSEPLILGLLGLFALLALAQVVLGSVAIVAGLRSRATGGASAALAGFFASALGLVGGLYGALLGILAAGGSWGRPLRVRGRQLHPELREGSDWTAGERPRAEDIDPATRAALEALWLHDAQKEHASVPAFARVSWLLAAAGAPSELLQWCHRAALEEIEHARRCFALAAGYGGSSHTAEPMPELLAGGMESRGDVLVLLATESLADGCLLEDFNADVAAECAEVCEEPVTRAVLLQIAAEERSHAELSWAIVRWTLEHGSSEVAPALERALDELPAYRRPTAVSARLRALVSRADPSGMRRHGRLPDERWAAAWGKRLAATAARAREQIAAAAIRGTKAREARLDPARLI